MEEEGCRRDCWCWRRAGDARAGMLPLESEDYCVGMRCSVGSGWIVEGVRIAIVGTYQGPVE